ncbi:MAG TPA: hypothetical protein VF618_08785 [Thermoanaerobaculia bacterium]
MILFNVILGLVPTMALAASIAAGTDDDVHHRRMFILVYGLWALTLAMWNWMRSYHVGFIAVWGVFGVIALVLFARMRRRHDGAAPL